MLIRVSFYFTTALVCVSSGRPGSSSGADSCESSSAAAKRISDEFLATLTNFNSTCFTNIQGVYERTVGCSNSVDVFRDKFNAANDGCVSGLSNLVDSLEAELAETAHVEPSDLHEYRSSSSCAPFPIQCIVSIYRSFLKRAQDFSRSLDKLSDDLYHRYIRCEAGKITSANFCYCTMQC